MKINQDFLYINFPIDQAANSTDLSLEYWGLAVPNGDPSNTTRFIPMDNIVLPLSQR
jgi:hypothetical protein